MIQLSDQFPPKQIIRNRTSPASLRATYGENWQIFHNCTPSQWDAADIAEPISEKQQNGGSAIYPALKLAFSLQL
jgi:hypothetical protein